MDDTYLERSRTVARLVRTSQQLYKSVTALARRYGLTESQYNALRVLRGADKRGEELNQAELARRLIASRANTTWILDKLAERKLIRRRGHKDRRKNLVEITSAGQALLKQIDPEFSQLLESVLGKVSDAQLETLSGIIEQFQFD